MVTKTKIKPPPRVSMFPIVLNRRERQEVLEVLGYSEKPVRQHEVVIEALEELLMLHFNRISKLAERPAPAHLKAELMEIGHHAQQLAEKISNTQLTPQARMALPRISLATLWVALTELESDVQIQVEKISKKGRGYGGDQKRDAKETRQSVRKSMVAFFQENVIPTDPKDWGKHKDEYLQNFLEICFDKLSVPLPKEEA